MLFTCNSHWTGCSAFYLAILAQGQNQTNINWQCQDLNLLWCGCFAGFVLNFLLNWSLNYTWGWLFLVKLWLWYQKYQFVILVNWDHGRNTEMRSQTSTWYTATHQKLLEIWWRRSDLHVLLHHLGEYILLLGASRRSCFDTDLQARDVSHVSHGVCHCWGNWSLCSTGCAVFV